MKKNKKQTTKKLSKEFEELLERAKSNGISRYALSTRALGHLKIYKMRNPRAETMEKLEKGLNELIGER